MSGAPVLVPMSAAAYEAFAARAVADYAQDSVASRRWPAAGALERAQQEFAELLPQGPATPDHHLFEIRDADGGATVGSIWMAVVDHAGDRSGYVYNVVIDPAHRRRGHALRAFEALEPIARGLGLSRIGLHVFGHNPGARALYERLGYAVTGLNMLKPLD